MSDQTMQDVLSRLETQEKELAQLRTAHTRRSKFFVGRKRRTFSLGIIALLVALVPLSILAAGPMAPFDDRDQIAEVHRGNADTLYNLGIANGSANPNDPNKPFYFPKDNVTREEMASFLARTASLNRMAYASLPSAAAKENLNVNPDGSANATNSRPYMVTNTLTVPGRAGSSAMLVKVDFTGYAFVRSTAANTPNPACPCLLRGEITVNGETAGGAPAVAQQIVTRTVVGANPAAIVDPAVAPAPSNAAERTDFSGSRVFVLPPGDYTFTMTLVRETGTATNVGFGFGNMQAQTIGFVGNGGLATTP